MVAWHVLRDRNSAAESKSPTYPRACAASDCQNLCASPSGFCRSCKFDLVHFFVRELALASVAAARSAEWYQENVEGSLTLERAADLREAVIDGCRRAELAVMPEADIQRMCCCGVSFHPRPSQRAFFKFTVAVVVVLSAIGAACLMTGDLR